MLVAGVTARVVMISQTESDFSEIPLISAKGIDYNKLRDLLKAGKWQEADRETAARMLEVAGRQKEGWLDEEYIDTFPCEDLRTIDQLWVKYSEGRFGFSVQAQIYRSLGGTPSYDEKILEAFGDAVSWRKSGNWLSYNELTFNPSAPIGHLPGLVKVMFLAWGGGGLLFSRVEACEV